MNGTNKAEIQTKKQSEKAESCRENSCNELQLKRAIKTDTDAGTEQKRVGKFGWFMTKT